MDDIDIWPRLPDSVVGTFSPPEQVLFRQLEQDLITAASLRIISTGQACREKAPDFHKAVQDNKSHCRKSLDRVQLRLKQLCPLPSEGFEFSLGLAAGMIEKAAQQLLEMQFKNLFGQEPVEWYNDARQRDLREQHQINEGFEATIISLIVGAVILLFFFGFIAATSH